RVVERSLLGPGGSITFAIPDHPWVSSEEGAAVRVAMTVGEKGQRNGQLVEVLEETPADDEYARVSLIERLGRIHANLTIGVDVASATPLQANDGISTRGVVLHGAGFQVTAGEASVLGLGRTPGLEKHIRHYINGKDLLQTSRNHLAIDLYGLTIEEVRERFPAVYQRLLERVKPERDQNRREGRRINWWVFGEPVPVWREMSKGLRRFLATVETSKHRVFVWLPQEILPDNMLVNIALEDAFYLGVLSSRIHVAWSLAAGGRLGIGNDPRYNKTRCFEPFPFPICSETQKQRIRDLGEALDAHRKRQQSLHPKLTLTGMYNVLEKLRSGEPLTDKEREIHEQGLVSVLKQIHDDLDVAVFDAYGWPPTLTDDEVLERLVALNHERAEEEKRGLVRWLRPEFQSPQGTQPVEQVSLVEAGLEAAEPAPAVKGKKAAKLSWPKDLPGRIVAVRDLLAELGQATPADISRRFKGVQAEHAEKLLESLAAVGVALETASGEKGGRTWSLVR
ncbi:MAG TPA: type IIL restriction-modification enzyme MmeI, partial [Thermoanaerobaculia bacterium]|nr:type IIL restriction-modification enzyme MmeI [Thermoanaerobaculia bacterium]